MPTTEIGLQKLAALVEARDFTHDPRVTAPVGDETRVAQLLAVARADDAFWHDLDAWHRETGCHMDVAALRNALPEFGAKLDVPAASTLAAAGLLPAETAVILDGFAAQAKREAAIRAAFQADSPVKTAAALEAIAAADAAAAAKAKKDAASHSPLLTTLLIIVVGLAMLRGCALYKGVRA